MSRKALPSSVARWGAWLFVVGLLPSLFGCARTHRLYDGPRRPAGEIAVLKNDASTWVRAIDGQDVPADKPDDFGSVVYELPPGEHRLEVIYHWAETTTSGQYTYRNSSKALNLWTLRHAFEAGKTYRLGFMMEGGGVWPLLIDGTGGKGEIVAYPELYPRPPTPPAAGEGTTLAGQGLLESQGQKYTATGRRIYLLRDTPEARDLLSGGASRRRLTGSGKVVRECRGYGLGYFEFRDVEPGAYLIYWGLTTDNYAVSPVIVRPGDGVIDGIRCDNPRGEQTGPPPTVKSMSV